MHAEENANTAAATNPITIKHYRSQMKAEVYEDSL